MTVVVETGVDPFTLAYRALVDLLRTHAGVAAIVEGNNWEIYDREDPEPKLETLSEADVPRIMVMPDRAVINLAMTSSEAGVQRDYLVGFLTGEREIDKSLAPLEWQLLRCFAGTVAANLGLPFVHDLEIASYDASTETGELRDMRGWFGLFTVRVHFHFGRAADMLADEPSWETG